MDKKSKILLILLVVLTIGSIYMTYRRAFIAKDYEVVPISPEEEIFE